jgi:glycogen debranching enzyme
MRRLIIALLAGLVPATASVAGSLPADGTNRWSADANGPGRFVAAHGQRSSIIGYPETGLEIWAYPLQLLSGYQLRFRESGRVEPFEGRALLSRIETGPSEVVRIYNGPDFVVREHLFVPLYEPAAILTYEVEGRPDVQIEARFEPSLNLMWPGALGGQEVAWNDSRSGYVERAPVNRFSAFIRSPEAIAHDSTVNMATNRPAALGLVMAPRRYADGVRRAELLVSQDQVASDAATASPLENRAAELRSEADAHYASVLANAVEITTPDPAVNRALEASILAVDEAWVCAPQIGCGNVGGYGPSRPGRRPQYAWFFAGDGLVAVESFLGAGRYERARDELEFIARYQNKTNGMIWHEMSTSAPLIDWEKRYPYMYVHVDITLQYLSTLSDYVEATGDTAFLKTHWPGVLAAWRYARSLVDPRTGLPSIPAGKQGQNEQAVLRDDVSLSVAWIEAAKAFASLARAHGDAPLAREGERVSEAALKSVRDNYWDEANGFWFGGHKASGEPLREHRSGAVDILAQGAFTPAQADRALDRLAGPDFQTDWGMRSLPASDPDYDPNAYSAGAVWGLGSSSASTTFWTLHRPFTGWNTWHGLVAWAGLDSPGHMHEVVAGDLFHPELESVPEQTWSSAGFLSAAVQGLLGIEIHAAGRTVRFAPHLPASWGEVSVKRLRVGSSRLDLSLSEDGNATTLQIDNPGAPMTVEFNPQIPLGARLIGATVNGLSTPASVMQTLQDQHVTIRVPASAGSTRAVVRYSGGVRIAPVETAPAAGDRSVNLKLASAEWLAGDVLKLKAYVLDPAHTAIDLLTPMTVIGADGADVARTDSGYRLMVRVPQQANAGIAAYTPVDVMVRLQDARR